MKKSILIQSLLAVLFLLASCQTEQEATAPESKEIQIAYSSTSPLALSSLRILLFDENQLLVQEQMYTSYPTTLRSPVGKFYFVFVGNAPEESDIYTLKTGVTRMSDYLHTLQLDASGNYYTSAPEFYLYTTPQAVELNTSTPLTVNLKRSVGMLNIQLTPSAEMKAVYANILSPISAINFRGDSAAIGTGKSIRQELTLSNGIFTGNIRCFPQNNIKLSYDVLYQQGAPQNYPVQQQVNVVANQSTQISTYFSKTVSSTVNYTSWQDSILLNYFAGFQVLVNVEGGNPINYTGLTVKVKNSANIITQYDSIPLTYQNGKLMFTVSRFIGSGNYTLVYARLHDRDGKLYDPNSRGTSLNIPFIVPGKNATVTLDGRQNEEEYHIRGVMAAIHGTVAAGSVWPGTTAYAQRCVPATLPTQVEGFVQKQWSTPSFAIGTPNTNNYFIAITVTSGEWRVTAVDMQFDTSPFPSGFADARFGGRVPYDLFSTFMYLTQVNFAKVNISYGSDISLLVNVKRLNTIVLNCDAVATANKLTGTMPTILSKMDMVRFEVNSANITGSLPTEYGNWKNLELIHFINDTSLAGTLPSSYGNFPKITMIRIMQNALTGSIPATFENYATMNVGMNLNTNYFTCAPTKFLARYNTNVSIQRTGNINACP